LIINFTNFIGYLNRAKSYLSEKSQDNKVAFYLLIKLNKFITKM
jgi:hypothetical protein